MSAQYWRIEVVRTGGFAGVRKPATASRADLSDEEAESLRALVERAEGPPADPMPDAFQYDLTIIDGSGRRHVTVTEPELEREQRALLRRLVAGA
jgi:hypothetical protein